MNKYESLRPVGENCHKHLKCFSKGMEITVYHAHVFEWQKRFKEVEDNSRSRRPLTSKTKVNIKQVRQLVWQLSVDCSNDHKSAEHEKGQCLKDYHQRFGHTESLHKNNVKTAE